MMSESFLKKLIIKISNPIANPFRKKLDSMERKIESLEKNLNFLINNSLDIQKIKPRPSVYDIQVLEFKIVERLDEFFKKIGVEYFFYGGALLGAVRHQGFVPWDDDVDLAVLKEDFEILLQHEKELADYGLFLSSPFSTLKNYTGVGYDKIYDVKNHLHVSICVFDLVETDDIQKNLKTRMKHKHKNEILRVKCLNKIQKENLFLLKEEDFDEAKIKFEEINKAYYQTAQFIKKKEATENTMVMKSLSSAIRNAYMSYKSVFPIQRMQFKVYDEQKLQKIPARTNPYEYIVNFYGKDYMYFPKDLYPTHNISLNK